MQRIRQGNSVSLVLQVLLNPSPSPSSSPNPSPSPNPNSYPSPNPSPNSYPNPKQVPSSAVFNPGLRPTQICFSPFNGSQLHGRSQ
eukprot:scaffold43688_cov42-Phaeocystis_antarctica.AAC.1